MGKSKHYRKNIINREKGEVQLVNDIEIRKQSNHNGETQNSEISNSFCVLNYVIYSIIFQF